MKQYKRPKKETSDDNDLVSRQMMFLRADEKGRTSHWSFLGSKPKTAQKFRFLERPVGKQYSQYQYHLFSNKDVFFWNK